MSNVLRMSIIASPLALNVNLVPITVRAIPRRRA
jgi:hypothetical protein